MPRPRLRPALCTTGAAVLLALAGLSAARGDGIMHVPAGAFWMGRDDGAPDEAPRHRVFLRDVWIEREKVTNAEFAAFLNAAGLHPPGRERRYDDGDPDARIHFRQGRWTADPGFEGQPVAEVSWFGARDYCAWRGRRLPTEAEWEKAARGDGGRAPGASPYGVEDMRGSLREWTASEFRPYPYRPDDGRDAGSPPSPVVVRGASRDDPAHARGVTRRHPFDRRRAAAGHHHVGFRCATSEDLGEVATPAAAPVRR
jgi:iron(II)-dependent oxidoreductase